MHGSWGDHRNWAPVVPALAESFRVLSYDRRGHSAAGPGESTRLAMIDWSRQQSARQQDTAGQTEMLIGETTQKRAMSEVQNAVAPLTFLLVFGYIISFFGVYSPDATWFKVISYVPFWTPTTMLVRIGVGGVAWWEIPMTIALTIVGIFVCAWISARIYRFGVLMYGQRPGLGQLAKLVRMK